MENEIDVVIAWVDGNDPVWIADKLKYQGNNVNSSNSVNRFRDWDNLQYIFRGIEQHMPWVRKVHLVTYGHIPKWLNLNNEKLNVVKHENYIPKEYLPTFNANVIELNFHLIDGLAEQFIYFNDDCFVLDHLSESDFFTDNLPNDFLWETYIPTKNSDYIFTHLLMNNTIEINKYFDKRAQFKKHWKKHFHFKYLKYSLSNLYNLRFREYLGFYNPHLPQSFLKKAFINVWNHSEDVLKATCKNKFRSMSDVNQYTFRNWQLVTGNFTPFNVSSLGKFKSISDDNSEVTDIIRNKRLKILCLNDDDEKVDFEHAKNEINNALQSLYPEKCSFEI